MTFKDGMLAGVIVLLEAQNLFLQWRVDDLRKQFKNIIEIMQVQNNTTRSTVESIENLTKASENLWWMIQHVAANK